MHRGLTDNKASVPDWARSLIVFCHGYNVMDLIDLIGAMHDGWLKDGVERHKANRMMIGEMASQSAIPAYLTLAFWFMLWIYTILPDYISRWYWRWV
jgi:hypothetical protein